MITEQNLTNLNFKKNFETAESFGSAKDWYYYTLDIAELCLISLDSDEAEEHGSWNVSLFNYDSTGITDASDLIELVRILKKITNK